MDDWRKDVKDAASALGLRCADVGDSVAVASVNPMFMRLTDDGGTLVIDACLLPALHGLEAAPEPTWKGFLMVASHVTESVNLFTECRMEGDHRNIVASLTVPVEGGRVGLELLARCVSDLNSIQGRFHSFLYGEMTEQEMRKIALHHAAVESMKQRQRDEGPT